MLTVCSQCSFYFRFCNRLDGGLIFAMSAFFAFRSVSRLKILGSRSIARASTSYLVPFQVSSRLGDFTRELLLEIQEMLEMVPLVH